MTRAEHAAFSAKLTAALVSEFNRPVIVAEVERIEHAAFIKGLEAARREVGRAGVDALSKVPAEAELWCGLVATNILAAVSYRIRRERKKARAK